LDPEISGTVETREEAFEEVFRLMATSEQYVDPTTVTIEVDLLRADVTDVETFVETGARAVSESTLTTVLEARVVGETAQITRSNGGT
jgi:hypothetical protein